jgi:hypothetical protein
MLAPVEPDRSLPPYGAIGPFRTCKKTRILV